MKLQYIAVIFIIIIVPISLVLAEYLNIQISTITNQSFYAKQLNDATYDTIKAFQFNTVHNRYSSVANSKLRDIKASTNTFFNSLCTALSRSREDLQEYVPALTFTLYDGYYIYSRNRGEDYAYELKPYIYYTCEYSNGVQRAIINYTLDNYITAYYYDGSNWVTKSGYLIDTDPDILRIVFKDDTNTEDPVKAEVTYDGVTIENEILKEHLVFEDKSEGDYTYIVYENKKTYYEANENKSKYFWYDNNNKKYIYDAKTIEYANARLKNKQLYSTSAKEYYINAYKFTSWVKENLSWINGNTVLNNDELKAQLGGKKIFEDLSKPEQKASLFNEHRMAVIRSSIQSNLLTAIATYNTHAKTNEYILPNISEIDWYTITNKVCVISFLQGIPIGTKYFNNYSVVSNSKNEEFIDKDSIYIVDENIANTNEKSYHKVGCKHILEAIESKEKYVGYMNLNFIRQEIEVTINETKTTKLYFYPRRELGCYDCTVSTILYYTADDIISGKNIKIGGRIYRKDDYEYKGLRKKYVTALAREKHDLYKSNNFEV